MTILSQRMTEKGNTRKGKEKEWTEGKAILAINTNSVSDC